jgi:hypothetical protein
MKLRRIVSTVLMGAMLFFAPSTIPMPVKAQVRTTVIPCGGRIPTGWLPVDTAFAGLSGFTFAPCPTGHHTPVVPWVVIGCAGSIVLSAFVAGFRDHRELTAPEAWTCGLLYWIPMPYQAKPAAVRTKG